ncbi:MAG: hypothetical protein WDN25_25085 [Acetobacteraceae bacterium]
MNARDLALPAIASLLLLAACGERPVSQVLNTRVTAKMSPDQSCNAAASVEYLPNGARITLPDTALFVVGRTDLSPCGEFALTSAVEAMLEPRLMQVVIEPGGDINAPYAGLPRERAAKVQAMFTDVGFAPAQPPVIVQPGPGAPVGVWGVVLTVDGSS